MAVLKKICDVAEILAIFLSWVPFLGPVLLGLAALGALLAILEASVMLATGEGSWLSLIGAVALGVVSCFGGKILTQFSRMSRARGVVRANGLSHSTGISRLSLSDARNYVRNPPPFRSNFSDPFGIASAGQGATSITGAMRQSLGLGGEVGLVTRMGSNGVNSA